MRLSQHELDIVRDSFGIVQRDPVAAGRIFYDHLFREAPQTRHLFVTDVERQAGKLIDTLRVVALEADNWGLLRPIIEDLAVRHTAYGVRPEHYPAVGAALVAMLAARMGRGFTPEVETVWRELYAAVETTMIAAAYPLHRECR